MTSWQEVKLGDVGDVKMCKRILKHQTSDTGDIPFFKIGTFGSEPDAFISKELFDEYKSKYSYPNIGDILISAAGTIGRVVVYDGAPAYYQDSNIVWISNDEDIILNVFLWHCYQIIDWQVENGGTLARLYNDNLRNMKVIVPSVPEQRAIVKAIQDFDDYLEKVQKKLEATRCLKKGLAQQIFSGKLRFKDDNGQDFPRWKEKELSEILVCGSKDQVDTSLYRKITVKLHKKGIEFAEINRQMSDTRPFYVRKKSEIIIGKQNYFNGSIAIVGSEFDGCICSNAIMSFSVRNNNDVNFVYEKISTSEFLGRREAMANGTGQKELSESEFLKFIVEMPCFVEQQKIADFLSNIDVVNNSLEQLLEKAKDQKKWLLNNLVTGRIRLKEFRDE